MRSNQKELKSRLCVLAVAEEGLSALAQNNVARERASAD
jgi:hypothetical protein